MRYLHVFLIFATSLIGCATHTDFAAREPAQAAPSCPQVFNQILGPTSSANASAKTEAFNAASTAYGSFAEIGAGQRVAGLFFEGKRASNTVFKSISAYGKDASNAIYGKASRFVSEERLVQQLDTEFKEIVSVTAQTGTPNTRRLFAFADTVTTGKGTGHGWMGLRFQPTANAPAHDIRIHVRLKNSEVLEQHEALGNLGVNLVTSAFDNHTDLPQIISKLKQNLSTRDLEIDAIRVAGPDYSNVSARDLAMMLKHEQWSEKLLLSPKGETLPIFEGLFKKNAVFATSEAKLGPVDPQLAQVLVRDVAPATSKTSAAPTQPGYFEFFTQDWGTPAFDAYVKQLNLSSSRLIP